MVLETYLWQFDRVAYVRKHDFEKFTFMYKIFILQLIINLFRASCKIGNIHNILRKFSKKIWAQHSSKLHFST